MKWTEKYDKWDTTAQYCAKRKGFSFSIKLNKSSNYYFSANNNSKGIRFNSLWEKLTGTLEEVKDMCETFDFTKHPECKFD